MDQRISFLTLAVRDLETSRRFYVDGLGWTPDLEVEGDVIMIMAGERLVLSLWDREHFQAEVGQIAVADGVPPFTISHNVATPRGGRCRPGHSACRGCGPRARRRRA